MGLRFRRVLSKGPLKLSLSKRGLGLSWGVPGVRIGQSPDGRRYIAVGLPGTGLYYVKYFGGKTSQ